MNNNKYIGTLGRRQLKAEVCSKPHMNGYRILKIWLNDVLIYCDVLISMGNRTLEELARLIAINSAKHGKIHFGKVVK